MALLRFFTAGFLILTLRLRTKDFPGPLDTQRRVRAFTTLQTKSEDTQRGVVQRGLQLITRITGGCCTRPNSRRSLVSVKAVKLVGTISAFSAAHGTQFTACTDEYVRGRLQVRFHERHEGNIIISLRRALRTKGRSDTLALSSMLRSNFYVRSTYRQRSRTQQLHELVRNLPTQRHGLVLLQCKLTNRPPLARLRATRLLRVDEDCISELRARTLRRLHGN